MLRNFISKGGILMWPMSYAEVKISSGHLLTLRENTGCGKPDPHPAFSINTIVF